MALARTWSVALFGVDGVPVEIEADISVGTPGIRLLGLPDPALRESKDRVRAAVRNSGENWPNRQVSLALSPAALPKGGSGYDVALACAVLTAAGLVPPDRLAGTVLLGELALDGRLRTVRGILPALLAARRAGLTTAIVPTTALAEAVLVTGVTVRGADTLTEVLQWLRGNDEALTVPGEPATHPPLDILDLKDVVGQPEARWALEVAAAGIGNHRNQNLLNGGLCVTCQRVTGWLASVA